MSTLAGLIYPINIALFWQQKNFPIIGIQIIVFVLIFTVQNKENLLASPKESQSHSNPDGNITTNAKQINRKNEQKSKN